MVDGVSEFSSIGRLLPQLQAATTHSYLAPVRANMHPYAPTPVIAKACASRLKQLALRGAKRIVVLLDREQRQECPSVLGTAILARLDIPSDVTVLVVVKDRTFENWLIADVSALTAQEARFKISAGLRKAVVPDKADSIQAIQALKKCCTGTYDKVKDSQRILERADILRMAANSRSFRRFLRTVDHPEYSMQSRQPS